MKIAVLGAGAVGCYYGGMLARAGHEITLIGRPVHVDAVLRDGLLLETREFRVRLPVDASTDAARVGGARLVLCCVKSTDTENAGADLARYLGRDALVLCLQNGVDNAQRLQTAVPCPVATAAVYVACEMAGPGHVRHHGRGDLVIGPEPAGEELAGIFAGAGIAVEISADVAGALWTKLIINCAYNALSAIGRLPYGRLVQGQGIDAVMRDVVEECRAVARAQGVALPAKLQEAVRAIAGAMPDQFSSTAQDLARGRRSEIDHLNGYVARQGEALGIATPVNRALHTIVRLLEDAPRDGAGVAHPSPGPQRAADGG
jgi:2-dehydropantoate 2-reductase